MATSLLNNKTDIIGWQEWLSLPELGIKRIKAKVDTGARSSALHAFDLEAYEQDKQLRVRFQIHPLQEDNETLVSCDCTVIGRRWVTNSGGQRRLRYVITTPMVLGDLSWPIEITLSNRDSMGFRMLLGRTALKPHLVVDPNRSFLMSEDLAP